MKSIFKYFLIFVLVGTPPLAGLQARDSYKKILKRWTRHDTVYVVENLEARLDWDATYQSPEFRSVKLEKTAKLLELSPRELSLRKDEEDEAAQQYDEFFVGAYAGSSSWSGLGKNTGEWSIVLEAEGKDPVRPVRFERVKIGQLEKILYPYLARWDQAYWLRFPKVVSSGEKFVLRMTGIPARSELVWK